MAEWKKTYIGQFLKERGSHYSPDDKKLTGVERLNKIDFSGRIHLSDKSSKTDMIIIEPGDLVISGINVAKGAIAVYQGNKPITATIHYSSYQFDKGQIDIEYFKRFVKSQDFIQALEVRGGIKTEIKPKHFLPIEINLPDINEQRRIVSFFRRVENEIGELGSEIATQDHYLDMLRQIVLQEAIEGKLTVEWRKQNPKLISDENHASKLLERIRIEKDNLIKKGKIRTGKLLPLITDDEKPFLLPDGWVWCRLNDLVDPMRPITYGIVKMGYEPKDGGVCALRCSDVRFRHIDITNIRKVTNEVSTSYQRTILQGDELLLNVRGTLGGCAIVPKSMAGFNIAREISLIVLQDKKLNSFMLTVLTSPFFTKAVDSNLRGIAYKGLNLNLLSNFKVPLPPVPEQNVIVEQVNKFMGIFDELEKQVSARKEQSEQLMQAVLREAFEYSHV